MMSNFAVFTSALKRGNIKAVFFLQKILPFLKYEIKNIKIIKFVVQTK